MWRSPLNVRLGVSRPLVARPIRDRRLDESLRTRTFEDYHTSWARRAGLDGTGARQYARKLVWLLGHRYTEPGLKGELLKGADRQLAALLGAGQGSERALLGWIEIRTVGDARTVQGWCWSDDDSGWDEDTSAQESLERREEAEDRAGIELHREDEYRDDDYRMTRVDPPANLPVLEMGPASRRDIWVEGLRSLNGERADYGRVAVETCELAPAEAVEGLETYGARVYEATGNEGAILELQYRHAALVVWQPNESALDILADCGGRTALAGEFATVRRLNGNGRATSLSDVAERWSRAMAADGGHPAPDAHRTLLAALREGEEKTYAHEIAPIDLDEAGARIVARELRAIVGRERTGRPEMLHQFTDDPRRRYGEHTNRSGAAAVLKHLLTDEAGLAIASRASPQKSRAVPAHPAASSSVGSASLSGFQSTSAFQACQRLRMRSRQPGPSTPGSIRCRSTLSGRSLRRTILTPLMRHHAMAEKKTASKAGRAAMPGSSNRPSFSRSTWCSSVSRSLRASFSHTGTACRMPFRITGGRSPGRFRAGRRTGWIWTSSASTFLGNGSSLSMSRSQSASVRTTTLWSTPPGSSSP